MSKINSNQKGKRGEREAAKFLNELFPGCGARRGQQFAGSPDSPDVKHAIPRVHIEVKRCEKLSLYAAMDQADNDAGDFELPLLLHKRNGKGWLAVCFLEDLPTLAESINQFRNLGS